MSEENSSRNRISLNNALNSKNYTHAFNKIRTNFTQITKHIQSLQDYSLRIGSRSDNKEKSEKM